MFFLDLNAENFTHITNNSLKYTEFERKYARCLTSEVTKFVNLINLSNMASRPPAILFCAEMNS